MEYVILDIETTGLDIETSSIIEVGALLIDGSVIKAEYQSFVRFSNELPHEIKRLTGITEDMVQDAPELDQVITELKSFVNKRPAVSHNGFRFDFEMLERAGLIFNQKYDSMEFAFFVLPTNKDGHSVQALADFFNLGQETHRALDDCKLEFAVIKQLAGVFTKRRKDRRESLKNVASSINWWWTAFLSGSTRPLLSIADLIDEYEPHKKRDANQERMSLETAPIEQSDVAACFNRQGGAATESYNEDRPEQKSMASVITESFNNKIHAVIEAGTGTGKSKAYLVPTALFSQKNTIPMVIATHTKALQDQLFNKEILHIKEIVSNELRVTLLKGKTNYVCLTKFDEHFGDIRQELFSRSLYKFGKDELRYTSQLSYLLLASWLSETERGDWDEVPYWIKKRIPKEIANEICNTDELCNSETCDLYDAKKCFLAKARLGARDSDLIIANHALVLSGILEDLVSIGPTDDSGDSCERHYSHTIFPGEAKFIVFDEAHHLEDSATSAWEGVVSYSSTQFLLDRLYGKRSLKTHLDALAQHSDDDTFISLHAQFAGTADKMRALAQALFLEIIPCLVPFEAGSPYRTKERIDALRRAGSWDVVQSGLADISDSLATVMRSLSDIQERVADDRLTKKIRVYIDLTKRVRDVVVILLDDGSEYVRYVERGENDIALCAAPVSIAHRMKDYVYDNYTTVMTSATLRVGNSFNFFAQRCGTALVPKDQIRYEYYPSSFDYKKQVAFLVPRGIVYNHNDANNHLEQCADFLERAILASNGGSLVLCSSHAQIQTLHERLKNSLSRANIRLLRQEQGHGTGKLIDDFRVDVNSVLIGTQSLWQGIDVPGESLRSLFILKIPYPQFRDPIICARREEVERRGGNEFSDYYEPLAALALKQGFGRLIRKATDRGIAVLLDEHLIDRPRIVASLPDGVEPRRVEQEVIIRELTKLSLAD